MGSDHQRNNRLLRRCSQGVCFGVGFLIGLFFVSGMFWILWCYLGLSIVQVSDTQRRALVNYSYTSPAPPTNRTDVPKIESSNAISRSATTSTTASRTLGRGESRDVRKETFNATAKGDFAPRDRSNVTGQTPERSRATQGVATAAPQLEDTVKKGSILVGEDEDTIHVRRISTSAKDSADTPENPRVDIRPTQVYDYDAENRPKEDKPRDHPDTGLPRRDDVRRRPNPDDRDPDFERDYIPRPPSRGRYDDEEDPRGSRSRYDRRERGRDTEDKLSKGDTRVYPDEIDERRSRTRLEDERYDERRDDEDRYRDRDVGRDDSRYRDEDRYLKDRFRPRSDEDRRRDRTYDRRYVDRDDDFRYRPRDERDRFRDDRYRGDEDRIRDDEIRDKDYRNRNLPSTDRKPLTARQNSSGLDDGRRYADSTGRESSGTRDSDRYDDRYDEDRSRDEYRRRDRDYRNRDQLPVDRRQLLPRKNSSIIEDRREYRDALERDRPAMRDRTPTEDRYRDDDYRRYDERDRIVPTRVREEYSSSRSSPLVTTDEVYDSRSSVDLPKDRELSRSYDRYPDDRDTRYYDDRRTDVIGTRRTDPEDREYRTRTSDDRRLDDREYRTRTSDERRLDDREYRTRTSDDRKLDDREYRTRTSDDKKMDDREYRTRTSDDKKLDDREYRTRTSDDRKLDDREYRTRTSDDRKLDDREYRTRTSDDRKLDDREHRTRTSEERRPVDRYADRRDAIVLDRRSYGSDELRRDDSRSYDPRIRPGDEEYVRRSRPDDEDDYRRSRPRGDYDRPRYREDDYDEDRLPSRKYDRKDRYRPGDLDDSPPRSSQRDDDRRRDRYPEDDRLPPPRTTSRDALTGSAMSPVSSGVADGVVDREKRYRPQEDKPERPLSAQEVIEAAHRHANLPDTESRKVFYPVFDPRVANLTTPEIIRPSERRGTTLGSRRKRTVSF